MPRLRRLRAFILHRTPAREKDRIVDAFTREEGRRRLFAPGVRHVASRRAGHLEPFMETRLVVSASSRGDAIREARVIQSFPRLRDDLDRLHVAYHIADLLRTYTDEGVRDAVLYDTLLDLIHAADTTKRLPPLLVESAQAHILRFLGVLPDLYRCTHCRKPLEAGKFALRSSRRGLWCEACGGERDPSLTDVVKILRLLLKRPVASRSLSIPESVQKKLRAFLRAHLRSHGPPKRVHYRV